MKKEFEKRTCKGNDSMNLIYTKKQFNLYCRIGDIYFFNLNQ